MSNPTFTISVQSRRPSGQLTRRGFIQVGTLGGLGLANLLRANEASPANRELPMSVVVLWLGGGPPQHETFDPKLDLPSGLRSVNGAIRTSQPGVMFGADFPRLAQRMNRLAVVRSFQSTTADHERGHKIVLSGGLGLESPSIGSVLARVRGTVGPTGMPNYTLISDPKDTFNFRAVARGADAGRWPQQFNPFQFVGDYPRDAARGANLSAPIERPQMIDDMRLQIPLDRLENRASLLEQVDSFSRATDRFRALEHVDRIRQQAYGVLRRGLVDAFDLSKEDPRIVGRYDTSSIRVGFRTIGYHPSILGKQMLLARRLCEAGCGFVLVQSLGWDFHNNDATPGLEAGLAMHAPELDQAASAFLDDIDQRGLSDRVLLVITGEMGRTPTISNGGRDHWASSTPLVLAGGGLRMGQVIGQSTRDGGNPATMPYRPSHLMATVMRALSLDATALRLRPNLPPEITRIAEAEPIAELF